MLHSRLSMTKVALCLVVQCAIWSSGYAFSPVCTHQSHALIFAHQRDVRNKPALCATPDDDSNPEKEQNTATPSLKESQQLAPNALLPADPSPSGDDVISAASATTTTTTAFMITNEMKRVLIEELGYKRRDVERMRIELAGPIIEKRVQCPAEGMPSEWCQNEQNDGQYNLQRLENESKYPLKFPLLGISLVLAGKGLTDALITIIKVQQGFRGASLTEEFYGVPVLGIDALCVAAGVGLGVWTWTSMQDEE